MQVLGRELHFDGKGERTSSVAGFAGTQARYSGQLTLADSIHHGELATQIFAK
jgi:hypothetical protein